MRIAQCPYSARTVPVQCPHSARCENIQCPYFLIRKGNLLTLSNQEGRALYVFTTGTVRALYGHCTGTVQSSSVAAILNKKLVWYSIWCNRGLCSLVYNMIYDIICNAVQHPKNQDPGGRPNSLRKPSVSLHLVVFSCLGRVGGCGGCLRGARAYGMGSRVGGMAFS